MVSYYKVNKLNSSILGISVDRTTRATLTACFSYPWATESVSYLGITLTPVTSSFYKANYIPLLNNTQKYLTRLSKYYLSRVGKVTTFKMSILTKMLYVFRVFPIQVPLSFSKNYYVPFSGPVVKLDVRTIHSENIGGLEEWGFQT